MRRFLVSVMLATVLLGALTTAAHAGASFSVVIGAPVVPVAPSPYFVRRPVVVAPAPVVIAPAPVYAPPPVVYAPPPVLVYRTGRYVPYMRHHRHVWVWVPAYPY